MKSRENQIELSLNSPTNEEGSDLSPANHNRKDNEDQSKKLKEIDSPAWNLFSSENESPATVNGISKAPRFPTRLESQSELDDHDPASSYSQKLLI